MRALQLLLAGHSGGNFNLGTRSGFSVRQILAAIEREAGRKVPHVVKPRRPGDPTYLVADPFAACKVLNFMPIHSDLLPGPGINAHIPFGVSDKMPPQLAAPSNSDMPNETFCSSGGRMNVLRQIEPILASYLSNYPITEEDKEMIPPKCLRHGPIRKYQVLEDTRDYDAYSGRLRLGNEHSSKESPCRTGKLVVAARRASCNKGCAVRAASASTPAASATATNLPRALKTTDILIAYDVTAENDAALGMISRLWV